MASPKWWTWVWVGSRSWWWTGKPGVLQSDLQGDEHDWATELNWSHAIWIKLWNELKFKMFYQSMSYLSLQYFLPSTNTAFLVLFLFFSLFLAIIGTSKYFKITICLESKRNSFIINYQRYRVFKYSLFIYMTGKQNYVEKIKNFLADWLYTERQLYILCSLTPELSIANCIFKILW